MKKLILIFVALILAVNVVSATGDVEITPTSPDADDDLTAYVDGYTSTTFDWYWLKDGATYYTSTGKTSTLDDHYTDAGDVWIVVAYVPKSAWYDTYEYGSASVTIKGEEEKISAGVVIDPSFPCDGDDLVGYVEGYEDTTFDWYWMKDGATYYTNTGQTSVLYESYTETGDEWTLVAYVPESAWYDTYEVGSASVDIHKCGTIVPFAEENSAPLATDIHLTVTEGDLVDIGMKQVNSYAMYQYYLAYTRLLQSDTLYSYDADGDGLKVTYDSLLNSFGNWQTSEGDAGVYTVVATVTDGTDSVDAEISITVLESGEIVNTCPVVSAEDVTVNEGELVVADYTASDEDGDVLSITFSEPLDANGEWQTSEGDAGVYTATITVTDGLCVASDEFTITVLENKESENHCPNVSAVDLTATEGDLVVADYTASDEDGDVLLITFSSPFNANGEWQTYEGDAGVYTAMVTASDGICSMSDEFTVTINEKGEKPEVTGSNYEGGSLSVTNVKVLNASSLYSAYGVSDLDVKTTGVFYVEDGFLRSTASDDYIEVLVEMENENSFDAEDIGLTFVFGGKSYKSSFSDLDRSEKASQVYKIAIPENLKSGSYPLKVYVTSDDVSYEEAINLDVKSLGDYINYGNGTTGTHWSFWEWLKSLLNKLF